EPALERIVAEIGQRLSSLIQRQAEVNSRVIETLQHQVLIGADGAHRGFDQGRNTDAALDYGVVHFSRNPRPLGQSKVVAVPRLSLLEAQHAKDAGAGGSECQEVEPGRLIEVRKDHDRESGFRSAAL